MLERAVSNITGREAGTVTVASQKYCRNIVGGWALGKGGQSLDVRMLIQRRWNSWPLTLQIIGTKKRNRSIIVPKKELDLSPRD
jgi:hypothetical protein